MKHTINSTNTKQMLADALMDLSCKKPFSKISVSELVNSCNINRKTFYYHFADIYDLLEWHISNEVSLAISNFDPIQDFDETIAYSFSYMNQNTYLKNFIQDPLAKDMIMQLLQKKLYPTSYKVICELEHIQDQALDVDFKDFLAKNLTRVIILSVFDSIEHPTEYEIEKLQKYISATLRITTNGLLPSSTI